MPFKNTACRAHEFAALDLAVWRCGNRDVDTPRWMFDGDGLLRFEFRYVVSDGSGSVLAAATQSAPVAE